MPLPPLDRQDPVTAQRLQYTAAAGATAINGVVYSVACAACGFSGLDRSFTRLPDAFWRTPDDLAGFAAAHLAEESRRKCPECGVLAATDAFRLFVMAPSAGGDLVVDQDGGGTTLRILPGAGGNAAIVGPSDPRVAGACLDSCLRAGNFLTEVPESGADDEEEIETAPRIYTGEPEPLEEPEPGNGSDAGIELLREVATARPEAPEAHLALARILFRRGEAQEAMECIQRASRHADGNLQACLDLGSMLGDVASQTRDGELLAIALDWYQQALAIDPGNPGAHLGLGRLLLHTGHFDQARPHLETASGSEAHAAEAAYNLGLLCLHTGHPEDAVRIFTHLSEIADPDPDIQRMLAWSLAKSGRAPEALAALDAADRISPGDEETEHFRTLIASGEDLEA